jgi:serine/threonine-protein kinase
MADSRYRITERVASGGMAEVFKGVAESLQGFRKNIAIKRILPALTQNKKFVAMFLDEARLSLSLQHANVVQVFDIGHSEDTYFIVMEYVDGVDLKALIEWRRRLGKRLPLAVTLNIINEICKGLAYAHELVNPETGRPVGIVHRDISPPNVLISRQGEVKVADFGLAKATSQLETTEPGVVKGKMSYLSPESARGEEVDSRSDIFSVGILLYELLTGKRLFYGETDYQTVELVRNAKIPPIRAQNPDVEQELEDVVRKALAQKVEDRFQSATDLQEELAKYSYSRGLKVISRDVADLVRACLEDRAAESGGRRRAGNILDTLLQDEINKFTSVDFEDPNARPQVDEDGEPIDFGDRDGKRDGTWDGNRDGNDDGFVDPRAWAGETTTQPVLGKRPRPTGSVPLEDARAAVGKPKVLPLDAFVRQSRAPSPGSGKSGSRSGSWKTTTGTGPIPSTSGQPELPGLAKRARRESGAPEVADPHLDHTPGPESLASVLEPLPVRPASARRAEAISARNRTLKIVGLVALVVIGAAAAATALTRHGANSAGALQSRKP